MARLKDKSTKKARKVSRTLPFGRKNYIIFAIGFLVILIGYFFLAQGPAGSFLSLSMAPVFLVIGYCVVIPIAILYKYNSKRSNP